MCLINNCHVLLYYFIIKTLFILGLKQKLKVYIRATSLYKHMISVMKNKIIIIAKETKSITLVDCNYNKLIRYIKHLKTYS